MSIKSAMTAIADAIRSKTGESGTLTLNQMAAAIAGLEIGSSGSSDCLFEQGTLTYHSGIDLYRLEIPVSDTGYDNYLVFAEITDTWKKVNGQWVVQNGLDFSSTRHNTYYTSQIIAKYPQTTRMWITVDGNEVEVMTNHGVEGRMMSSWGEQNGEAKVLNPVFGYGVQAPTVDTDNSCVIFTVGDTISNNIIGTTWKYAIVGWNNG